MALGTLPYRTDITPCSLERRYDITVEHGLWICMPAKGEEDGPVGRLDRDTLARTGGVREAKWAEFDREEGVWTVPGEWRKNRREHRVPLSQRALATLEELHKMSGTTLVELVSCGDL